MTRQKRAKKLLGIFDQEVKKCPRRWGFVYAANTRKGAFTKDVREHEVVREFETYAECITLSPKAERILGAMGRYKVLAN